MRPFKSISWSRLPAHGEPGLISTSFTRRVLPCSLRSRSRKPTTWGRIASLAMRKPPIWLGETVALAPAFIIRSANLRSVERLTIRERPSPWERLPLRE